MYVNVSFRISVCTLIHQQPAGNWLYQSVYVASVPSAEPTPTPTSVPSESPTFVEPPMECLLMTGSPFDGFFDGTWTKSSDAYGDYYTLMTELGEFALGYYDWCSGYAVTESRDMPIVYMYCPDVDTVTDCTAGKWILGAGTSVAMAACDAAAFKMNSDSANGEGDTEDDGWKVVLIVVIVGLVLIAVGIIVFCVYMKRRTAPKRDMGKMEKGSSEGEMIEVQCELEASDNETTSVTQN